MTSILKNGLLTVAVAAKGAELQSIQTHAGREFLWQGDPACWGRRAPVLFPIGADWSKPGGAPFVCLEPWHGVADPVNATGRLEDKPGIIRLASGKDFRASYKIMLLG